MCGIQLGPVFRRQVSEVQPRVNAVDAELGNHTAIVSNVAYKVGPVFMKVRNAIVQGNRRSLGFVFDPGTYEVQ